MYKRRKIFHESAINFVTQKGISALMYAIQPPDEEIVEEDEEMVEVDEEIVKVLVEGGANLNSANEVS